MSLDVAFCSTAGFPQERAFDCWVDAVRTHVTPIDLTTRSKEDFYAEFRQRRIGPITFSRIIASQQEALRETRSSFGAQHRYDLVHMRSGTLTLEQDGSHVTIGPNESLILSHLRNFSFTTSHHSDCFLLACPDDWLTSWLPDPGACVMQPVGAESHWAAPIGSLLTTINQAIEESLPMIDNLVADQIGGCLALLYQGVPLDASTYRRRFRRELMRSIRSQFARPELSPALLAEQYAISVRHLHSLLASGGTSFGRELLATRLERAREMLRDPRYTNHTIGEIAAQCGFKDPAHLARRFQEAFGTSPSSWRKGD
jgi:AraC-like DNA-binding protein